MSNMFQGFLNLLIEGARELQLWLNNAARQISKTIKAEDLTMQQLADTEQLKKMGLLNNDIVEDIDAFDTLLEAVESDMTGTSGDNYSDSNEIPDEFQEFEKFNQLLKDKNIVKPSVKTNSLQMSPVTWTTPLGMPIIQPYYKKSTTEVRTQLQTFSIPDYQQRLSVNVQKQSTAFPPNFVHSLDACHMMLSAVACQQKNICFAAVHDSYWTHASSINEMNTILREAFVQLHSQDILNRLRKEFYTRYSEMRIPVSVKIPKENIEQWNAYLESTGSKRINVKSKVIVAFPSFSLPPLPPRGELNVNVVRDSTYFFH